jgi:peptide deformylase
VEEHLSGLIARVFQHERDHLDGICFDTKVGPVTLQLARQRQKKKLR